MNTPTDKAEFDSLCFYLAYQIMHPDDRLGANGTIDIPEELTPCRDENEIRAFCAEVIERNPKLVEVYKRGKTDPLAGKVSQESYGRIVDAKTIQTCLKSLIDKISEI